MIFDQIAFRSLLNKGEEIKYVAHVHAFMVYPQLFKVLIFGLLMPVGGYLLFPPFFWAWLVWAGIGAMLFVYKICQWYLDAWIVTNFAVIDQEWNSFFNKTTIRIEHGNTEGVTTEIRGFWGTILSFGTIKIEHMSGEPVVLSNVSSPRKLERKIIGHQQEFMQRQNFQDHGKLKDMLTNLLRASNKNV